MRLVPDTSVVVAAFRSIHGASRAFLTVFDDGRFTWLLSNSLLTEYEAVLTRPEQMRVHRFSRSAINEFLDSLIRRAERVEPGRSLRPQLRDANDELVLETAVFGVADAIVTHNVRHFVPATSRFGIAVLTPGEFLRDRIQI